IIPTLKLKMGLNVLSEAQLGSLTEVSRYVHELANLNPNPHAPFVGGSAFAHKAGLHADAVMKHEDSYQHIDPNLVGNHPRFLVSELAGRASVINKARELGIEVDQRLARLVLEKVKAMESRGFQYELAEASFELLVRRAQSGYQAPFELVDFFVVVEKHRRPSAANDGEEMLSEATVKVRVGNEVMHTAAEGNGPVNALDAALRKALVQSYPGLAGVKLVDYKVRILDETAGTEAQVRVLIESSDGESHWRTVGSSTNIIEASWLALADAMEYRLLKRQS
ncbi:MAG: citramalate synthase, partial [Chloroflexi bacterium]|nr:citramalate synthase [Chloroflexota bacterium]